MDEAITIDRRKLLKGCLALGAGALCAYSFIRPRTSVKDWRPKISRVAVLKAASYSERLDQILMDGLNLLKPDVRGKSVLLKPNLVEYLPGKEVNTHPSLVGAAAECFLHLGAKKVVVGEGPGHQRDTQLLLWQSGLEAQLKDRRVDFVDLNYDELIKTRLKTHYTGIDHLWLPRSVLESDFLVSMPKVKTHHWAGVTLSMKNMFGIVPGLKYGWPKNILHWKRINESILDICATEPIQFVIADGIMGMEGNGPLHGEKKNLGVIVIGDDPVAADATVARLMGLRPERVQHLLVAGRSIGNLHPQKIRQLGEPVGQLRQLFKVAPGFSYLSSEADCWQFYRDGLMT